MRAPFFTAFSQLTELQLVSDTFNLELPFFLTDVWFNDCILSLFSLELSRHFGLNIAATEVEVFVDIITAFLRMNLICHVSITFHVVIVVIGIVLASLSLVSDDWSFELESAGQTSFRQLEKNESDALAVARLQLVRVDVDIDAQVLQLDDDVLTCGHRVVILVPAGDLMLVDG